jgi:EAL domain-containing protein (putative c-di-GMP-specific phosphodiesterase class I)
MEKHTDLKNIITNMFDDVFESGDKPFGFFPEMENKLTTGKLTPGNAVKEISEIAGKTVQNVKEDVRITAETSIEKAQMVKETVQTLKEAAQEKGRQAISSDAVDNSSWKDTSVFDEKAGSFGMQEIIDGKDAFFEKMKAEGKQIGVLSIQLLGLKEFERKYDEKERTLLLGTVAEEIRKSCDADTLIGSVVSGNVVILTACSDRQELKYFEEQLTKVLTSIHHLPDGVPVTLYFLIGGALHRETRELGETIAFAKVDMKSQEAVRQASLDTRSKDVVSAISALRHAIDDKTLEVLYRPRIGGISNQVVAFGAAVRWKDEAGKDIPARDFYEDIIHAGFSDTVERYVVETICHDLRAWETAGKRALPVSVHLALKSFEDPGYFSTLQGIIEKYHVNPYFITIEFAMRELRENPILAEQVVMSFRNYGYRVHVNEFSGDFQSLGLFGRIPIDIVRLTVQNNPLSDEKSRIVMREMVNMLKKLGVYIAVDRIETEEQAEFLRAIGCNYMSGDFFGKRLKENEIEGYLKEKGYKVATQTELDMLWKLGAVNPMDLNSTERIFDRKILEEHTVSYLTRTRAKASDGVNRDRFETIYTNEMGLEKMKKLGFQTLREMNDFSNSPGFIGYQQVIDCMNQCKKLGDVTEMEFRGTHLRATLRMELVYELDGKQYFLSLMRNPVVEK